MKSWQVLLVGAVCAAGCHKQDPLVGTWQSTYHVAGHPLTNESTFNEDGTCSFTSHLQGQRSMILVKDQGTWKWTADKKLEVHITSADWSLENSTPETNKRFQALLAPRRQKILEEANNGPASTIKLTGDDTFTEIDGGITHYYRRKNG